jgi:CxxC motif-containing protein (DUF1111 family)
LLGDGYIEAIDSWDIEENARQQREAKIGIAGVVVSAPVLEASGSHPEMRVGRFGWKSQHSSLMSSCADSLRNELGIRNRLYPEIWGQTGRSPVFLLAQWRKETGHVPSVPTFSRYALSSLDKMAPSA